MLRTSMHYSQGSPTRIVYSPVRNSTVMGYVARLRDDRDKSEKYSCALSIMTLTSTPKPISYPLTECDQCDHTMHPPGAQPSILTPRINKMIWSWGNVLSLSSVGGDAPTPCRFYGQCMLIEVITNK